MPLIRKEGKDTIIFASKEEHSTPSKVDLPEAEPSPGLLLPNGDINWNCPCLGGMATGPCGLEFREAFSCFHYSTSEPKGSDCVNAFKTMQMCMVQYPALYGNKETSADDMDDDLDPIDDSDNKGFLVDESTDKQKDVSAIRSDAESKSEERPDTSTSKKQVERTNVN